MRIMMIVASGLSYFVNDAIARARYGSVDKMNFEAPLTSLVWLTSIVSVALTYLVSYLLVPGLGDGSLWWKLSIVSPAGLWPAPSFRSLSNGLRRPSRIT